MDNVIRLTAEKKKELFREFLLARNPSEKFARTYFTYLHSTILFYVAEFSTVKRGEENEKMYFNQRKTEQRRKDR